MKRNAISVGLIGAFFFAIALSGAPELHHRIHADANRVEHTCAVTLIAGGNYHHSVATPISVSPTSIVDLAIVPALNPAWVPSPFLGAHIFEHAPPQNS